MALAGKHTFGEIDGTRVTFVEKKIGQERIDFLTELLEFNGLLFSSNLKRKSQMKIQIFFL